MAHLGVAPAPPGTRLDAAQAPPALEPGAPGAGETTADEPVAPAAVTAARVSARITPVAEREWQWRLRMDEARMAKLERLKGMLAHAIPDGDLDRVFDQMLEDSLAIQGKKRGFIEPSRAREPAPPKPRTPGERAPIPRAVRREVLKRDGYRCTWVHPDGSRCEATARLEMDHLEPARETGSSRAEDLTTRCGFHNRLRAVRQYGREYVHARIGEERRAREVKRALRTEAARDLTRAAGPQMGAGA